MSLGGPLRTELTKYRKRKQFSLDGSVAGAEPTAYRRGTYPATPHGFAPSTRPHSTPSHFESYDPGHAAYDWDSPDYRPPAPWFDGRVCDPPMPERIAGSPPEPKEQPVRYEHSLLMSWQVEQAIRELTEAALWEARHDLPQGEPQVSSLNSGDIIQSAGEGRTFQQETGDEAAPMEHPSSDPNPSQDLEAFLAPEEGLEQAASFAETEAYDQQMGQGLEALVQDAVLEQDPFQQEDDPFEQQRRMYDQQMQQLMDPFMMQGFGM